MAAKPRPVFLRPYVLETATPITLDGSDVTIEIGTYANVLACLMSLAAQAANDAIVKIDISLSDDFRVRLQSPTGEVALVWIDTDLRDALGFAGTVTIPVASAAIASYCPTHAWLPGSQRSDQGVWYQRPNDWAAGAYSEDGTWIGARKTTTPVWYRDIEFTRELATNLLTSAQDATDLTVERCLETFLKGAVQARPCLATAARATGFWYYDDVNDLITEYTLLTTDPWSDGTDIGVQFGKTESPDLKVFCSVGPDAMASVVTGPGMPVGLIRYNTAFSMRTAPAPTWPVVRYVEPE